MLKKGGPYNFTSKENFEDYSSGRVLIGANGASNFPVRLISEIFLRSVYILQKSGVLGPCTIWDPFCGAGYALTVLGFIHPNLVKKIYASDVSEEMVSLALQNLALLTKSGLSERKSQLEKMFTLHGKASHKEALESLARLEKKIEREVSFSVFQYDVFSGVSPSESRDVDLMIFDLPYGRLSDWKSASHEDAAGLFLKKLKAIVSEKTLVCVVANKKQDIPTDGWKKVSSFKVGLRKVLFLQANV